MTVRSCHFEGTNVTEKSCGFGQDFTLRSK